MDPQPWRPEISTENTSVSKSFTHGFLTMVLRGSATVALGVLAPAQTQDGARPSAVSIHLDRCVAYYNRGNLSQAIAEVRKAQRLLPNDPDINFVPGNALYRSADMRGAASAYGRVLALRPTHFEARIGFHSGHASDWN
jgi:Flp pilus assembly protein TadD